MTKTSTTKSQEVAADIVALLRARNPLLWVVTREEARVERYLIEAAIAASYVPRTWDVAQGIAELSGNPVSIGSPDPGETMNAIRDRAKRGGERGVWIMRDLPAWLSGPAGVTTQRQLRNLARMLPGIARDNAQAIIILTPSGDVPAELAGHATVLEWPLPDRAEIADILDAALDALPPELKKVAATNGIRDQAIDAAVGLSGEEAAACYARSLVQLRKIDPATVAKEKRRVVARERVLEWHDPLPGGLDSVGGLDNLKTWLAARRSAYSVKARAYGLPAPKGAVLVGVPGCLAEGTRVAYKRGKRPSADRSLPIEVLFEKFNGASRVLGHGVAGAGPRWLPDVPTFAQSWDAETGRMVFNEIMSIIDSGVKECMRVVTDIAGSVELTGDHPILCDDGSFKVASDLNVGDGILVRGSMKPVPQNKPRVYLKRTVIEGLKYHPVAWRKIVVEGDKRYEYGRITKARLVVEASMNRIEYDEFVRILKEEPERAETLAFLPADYDVHHADENQLNDDLGNLVIILHSEHPKMHDPVGRFNVEHTRVAIVTSLDVIGHRRTFDMTMAEPLANFAVNDGIVVHNCGKSLTAKAIATAWGVPLLRLDLGALRSKFVGESEGNIRRAFRVIEAIGRCVVWIDEVEKALQGATSGSADGGVSSDALGAVLSWMQERSGEAFVIATANDVEALPPELLRKGRFDEVWFVDLPTEREREGVLAAALRQHGRGSVKINLNRVAQATDGFTGAEIATLVPDALFVAFADGAREITTADLVEASRTVVPLSKTAAEKIKRLREWAASRARPATSPTTEAQKAQARSQVRVLDV